MVCTVRRLILVWTRKRGVVSHCLTWFQTQQILTACQIRCHRHLWEHRSIGRLRNLIPRRCLTYHMMHRVTALFLVHILV